MSVFGMWMWAQSVEKRGAEPVIRWCARAGVTDVYFLTKGLAGTTAFLSTAAPSVCERDLLQEVLDAAHRQGIRVHAWFTSACDDHYKRLHPDSGRCHFFRGKDRELISLADEGYLSYMEDIIHEVCVKYELDGVHLDYIRYNHLLYGWAEEDLARYAAEGADPVQLRRMMERMFCRESKEEQLLFDAFRSGDENAAALARTRRKDVQRFAQRLIAAALAAKRSLTLSAALMPEGAYDDTAFADLHYGQNYEDAAKLYDAVLPMAYTQAYGQQSDWVRRVAEGTLKRRLKTIVGLQAYDGRSGPALQKDLAALKGTAIDGVCLFREGATALAFVQGRELCVCNALDEAIVRMTAANGEQRIVLREEIGAGMEKTFVLPFQPCALQVDTAAGERCIYLAGEEKA